MCACINYISAHIFCRTLLGTVNAISTLPVPLDTVETQFVQSFYDTTYRAHMIRCLLQALKLFEKGCGVSSGNGEDDYIGNVVVSTNRSVLSHANIICNFILCLFYTVEFSL